MKIYTRTGDKGQTSLFTGERVPKNNAFIAALGSIDECNSTLGVAVALLPDTELLRGSREQLETIQHALFDIGAAVATPRTKAKHSKLDKTRFEVEDTTQLEQWIDEMEATLPPLHTFILPGGHPAGAMIHVARTICRGAEREIIALHEQGEITDNVLIYVNRLSDYLFVAARFVNARTEKKETLWQPHKGGKRAS